MEPTIYSQQIYKIAKTYRFSILVHGREVAHDFVHRDANRECRVLLNGAALLVLLVVYLGELLNDRSITEFADLNNNSIGNALSDDLKEDSVGDLSTLLVPIKV
jgi:hypothetical protein